MLQFMGWQRVGHNSVTELNLRMIHLSANLLVFDILIFFFFFNYSDARISSVQFSSVAQSCPK